MNFKIAERNRWQTGTKLEPLLTGVECTIDAELGRQEEQIRADVILNDPPTQMLVGQVTGHQFPRTTTIGTFDNVRLVVSCLVIVETGINCVRIVQVSFDIVDEEVFWHVENAIDFAPILSTVF